MTGPEPTRGGPAFGLTALSAFFAFGTAMSALAGLSLLIPGRVLEPLWRVNPAAREAFGRMNGWAPVLLLAVSVACAASAWGIWTRAEWGRRVAIGVLVVNLAGDSANALLRHDLRTLIGLPIGAALILYLTSAGMRGRFAGGERGGPASA